MESRGALSYETPPPGHRPPNEYMKRELLHEIADLIKQSGEYMIDGVAVFNDVQAFKDKWMARDYSQSPVGNGDEEIIEVYMAHGLNGISVFLEIRNRLSARVTEMTGMKYRRMYETTAVYAGSGAYILLRESEGR